MANILVVDDERSMREFLEILLQGEGHEVSTAVGVSEALEVCRRGWPDLIFVDLKLDDGSGMDVLRWTRENDPDSQVIMITAFATTKNAVDAMRLGAYDYQIKPFKVDEIRVLTQKALEKQTLLKENRELRARLRSDAGLSRIVGRSPRINEVVELIHKVARAKTSVLIEGESGTGKELAARAIHEASPRADKPFLAVNCGAIPESLIESELFGHSAGAFTGASRSRPGLFRSADGGTLLLDEVGELSLAMQVKLLRVLEERAVRAVGEEREVSVDVRILASTNRDLQRCVEEAIFREDLFYRLNVVRLRMPPLRERVEDIPLLARTFVAKHAQEMEKQVEGVEPDAMRAVTSHSYPGNVRELENCMERAVALASGSMVRLADLPEEMREAPRRTPLGTYELPEGGVDLEELLKNMESHVIRMALQRVGGVKTHAASLLGLSFRSFRYRLQKLGMEGEEEE